MNPNDSMRLLVEKLEKTKTNAEFLMQFTIQAQA
jgi:transcription termination factor Rho